MSTKRIHLKGITWNHSRGFTSVVATAQRFSELNPNVDITWEKRSLQAFADEPINELAKRYDLLIIDHPWAGFAGKNNVILALDEYLPKSFMKDLDENSVGRSHESYSSNGHQWALAVDAATPVASSRPDLFEAKGLTLPETYDDLLNLAKQGLVIMPGIPQDTLMNFYMMCCTMGEDVCTSKEHVVSEDMGIQALKMLRELAVEMDDQIFNWNPIQVYEAMTLTDKYAYCPWAYGYTNYSRNGYARKALHFHDMVDIKGYGRAISTLGGTGLAVSVNTKEIETVMKYVEYTASEACQKTIFFDNGGQPGHRKSWTDEHTNSLTANFFKNTLPSLDRAFLRPRYNGHMYFQDRAGAPIREYMMNGGNEKALLEKLNTLYRKSLDI
ncbi:carbohydrate ABC transporter substrate-binding protein [Tamlana fucoidanivorans]|uniref:Carbohydrate ABC transporter substrate-binding protein n=1 Tax=Allotamlana fucoidanivorans TaxID=2583814 RepID=A0A5C4SFQ9_9FLAO|nr:ABC transporter substrate-binding protein [Tamlana fucoidanivorans]TNJ42194.1 carbohydrate ABC transporter substrate-binding protein [Tamlana fucoidanivorans]